ncbi:MAG: thioredoxin family protein [Phormidium sp. BM_Day4_Bin.17]|nr:thioredoxin family protein [Phormidium sp. BM_Day4_Bin.17]UCJ11028.1 MAG: thioredoxin family protein [Phormidium sp. PBR-2020]
MNGTEIGAYAPDFELPGTNGTVHHLARYLDDCRAVVVVFLSNACPHCQAYLDRLKGLQRDVRDRQVKLVAINPNNSETFESMKALAREAGLNFPYLRDVTQDVAQCFGVTVTPEAFLIDNSGILCYRGRIDDCAESEAGVKQPYLQEAIEALLGDRPITPSQTEAEGCPIIWHSSTT